MIILFSNLGGKQGRVVIVRCEAFFLKPSNIRNNIVNREQIIQETAFRTVQIEQEAIQSLYSGINESFVAAVIAIFQSKGRVVLTGIGKSAIIAQKIVATLNSTGTPAIFMHAADAIHGDLGMVLTDDIVVCLSKSGETPEVKVLVPFVKNLGNLLIAIVANPSSFLAQHADFVLHTPISKEADPNNLAPTASTTAQVVMGDALATSLLALRGFTPSDFAQFHPGGALGKQLYLRVKDLVVQNERPHVFETTNIRQTILEMTSKRLGCAVVINDEEQVLGIITDGDLRRMLENDADVSHFLAKDIMTLAPKTIQQKELAVNALQMMRQNSITQLIVEDEKTYVGIIHLHDLIREGLI